MTIPLLNIRPVEYISTVYTVYIYIYIYVCVCVCVCMCVCIYIFIYLFLYSIHTCLYSIFISIAIKM